MTLEEAKKVADILNEADEGCPYCVSQLHLRAVESFPEFEWTFDDDRSSGDMIKVTAR